MYPKEAKTVILNEDVILEIVVRLPLKSAIRCMVLNKSLFRSISQLKKALVSSAYPNIEGNIFFNYETNVKMISSTTLRRIDLMSPVVLDSCNGVLLLKFEEHICIFNAITGETMAKSHFINELRTMAMSHFSNHAFSRKFTVALAVDLNAQTTFQFKLVVAEILNRFEVVEKPLWRFTVFVPSGGTSWLKETPVEFMGEKIFSRCDRFVYVDGCVYYADERNQRIVVFDVENGKATSINLWHEITLADNDDEVFLFGTLSGSLHCVYVLQHDIQIHSYDKVKDVWQMKHKIANIVSDPKVQFCNEQRLLIVNIPPDLSVEELDEVLYMYDISIGEWEKIRPEENSDDQFYYPRLSSLVLKYPGTYFSYVPTLAKVSDKYMHDPDIKYAEGYLRRLQRLVLQETET